MIKVIDKKGKMNSGAKVIEHPYHLYNMKHINLIRKIVKDYPPDLYLIYKFKKEPILDLIKFPLMEYRIKSKWHTALKRLQRLGLITYGNILLHRIEPEKVKFTKYFEKVTDDWENSILFKAFSNLRNDYFKISQVFIDLFFKEFLLYKTNINNQSARFQRRKGRSSRINYTIEYYCGVCGETQKYFISQEDYEYHENSNICFDLICKNCKKDNLIILNSIDFGDKAFSSWIYYGNSFDKKYYNQHDDLSHCGIILKTNNRTIPIKNLLNIKDKICFEETPITKTDIINKNHFSHMIEPSIEPSQKEELELTELDRRHADPKYKVLYRESITNAINQYKKRIERQKQKRIERFQKQEKKQAYREEKINKSNQRLLGLKTLKKDEIDETSLQSQHEVYKIDQKKLRKSIWDQIYDMIQGEYERIISSMRDQENKTLDMEVVRQRLVNLFQPYLQKQNPDHKEMCLEEFNSYFESQYKFDFKDLQSKIHTFLNKKKKNLKLL